ncbi:hypothetical protein PMAYCL1PPCAC_22384, partial [Pristionchus mayeri]
LSPPTMTKISSVSLAVELATVPVSKEVLGITSDFFTALFYGDFMERNSGSYSIKEVDHQNFIWLVNSLTERKWKVTSVDQALYALFMSDRFCMKYVKERIVPYLNSAKFDPTVETLKRYIAIVVRCSGIGEVV